MDYKDMMQKTIDIYNERASQYGDVRYMLDRQSKLATLMLGRPVTAYDVAMILHACKLGRIQVVKDSADSYMDGINYLAFAGAIATEGKELEDGIADMAKKFAPRAPIIDDQR